MLFSVLVWPGVGHMYARRFRQGLLLLAGALVGYLLVPLTVGLFVIPCVYLGASIHSYKATKQYNAQYITRHTTNPAARR